MRGGGEGEIHCLKYHYKSERKGRRGGRVRAGVMGERVEKDIRGYEGGRGGKAGRGEKVGWEKGKLGEKGKEGGKGKKEAK